ncbi:tryptophan--tRNA ligase [Winogradskyella bathintestinalis]|uniref:Tryptophan--tRNA ligase n=3 Tax=Flavobacteriaceae TaxID=49546 RepID=A0ABT7ZUQ9_9FLAO|nr:tryptophan--tRNA ligase [Winogradskyella bathintestinalis]MBC3844945.1 tryptophan--tRNA ligase [Winogradskyella echinorum]MBC5749293.1 tryptophan--tRNA ligase [Winogradskyella echinorum]MDN3492766.1 tryptophan--tRNA ligase [Winogradskyella bathintestinalis]
MINKSFEKAKERSKLLENDLYKNPQKYRVLTGDRPTGNLHLGHYFGSIINRLKLQSLGIETYILIADYQVLTDRNVFNEISKFTYELTLDYLACGLDPENYKTHIFPHSHIPELNQLTIPFLTLVSSSELNKNPTVKEEITASGLRNINAGMYIYPVHQAADILFCKSNVVPVGKDQLPHIELTRKIAKRFNTKFNKNIFTEPVALFTDTPTILGLDGIQKMSKSRNNSIMIKSTADETAKLIKSAKTDSSRYISYDPENRPEVSNLLKLASLCSDKSPSDIAHKIGDQGSGKLKQLTEEAINTYFEPIRKKRIELEKNKDYVRDILLKGISKARETAIETLSEVTEAMNMKI